MRKLTEGSLSYDSYKWCLKIRRRKWNGFFSHQLNNRVGWHFSWIIKQHFRVNNAAWEADLSCNIKPIVVVVFYRPYIMPILSRAMPRKVLPDVPTDTQFFSMEVWAVGIFPPNGKATQSNKQKKSHMMIWKWECKKKNGEGLFKYV